jgi:magnesium-transporting ATPase (P-type)
MLPSEAIVVRDGHEAVIAASELVKGDIVKLRPGSRVPADLRLIQVSGLKVTSVAFAGLLVSVDFGVISNTCSLSCSLD